MSLKGAAGNLKHRSCSGGYECVKIEGLYPLLGADFVDPKLSQAYIEILNTT